MAPSPYFSIMNVCLEDINVFARFDEIPSLPVENIKEKPKCRGCTDRWMDGQTDGQCDNSIRTPAPTPPQNDKEFAAFSMKNR